MNIADIKWDIRKGSAIYSVVYTPRLASWIVTGKIKKGEAEVWRSGLSGWRKPEDMPELQPYFKRWEKEQLKARKVFPSLKERIESVLVIDDEEDLDWLLSESLTREGFSVKVAKDGKSGIECVKSYFPDLVLLDEKLPDILGIKVLSKIKEIDPSVVVFMISAYGTDQLKKDARREGAYYFIDKPFGVEKITKAIKNYLKSRKKVKQGVSYTERLTF